MGMTPSSTFDPFASLNAAQQQAVGHVEGPLLVLAGPGSGKTRVITHRIAHLLQQGVPAWQILALTFTNKAADEMRIRLQRLVPQPVWMGTFHRFCAQLLRIHAPLVGLGENYSIFDTADSRVVLKQAMEATELDFRHITPDSLATSISVAKNNLLAADQYQPPPHLVTGPVIRKVYQEYQRQLLAANGVDFDDLLLHVATMLRDNPELRQALDERYRFILVDEYQDTNLAQYAIVRALSVLHPNLAVTGDPDQSIYSWRGANLNNILEFEKDYPQVRVVRLEENYRSTKRILNVAQQLIANNVKRKEKRLFTANPEGLPVRLVVYPTGRDEAEDIAEQIAVQVRAGQRRPRDFAIFYRTNALSRLLEDALRQRKIAYQIVHGLEFYQRKEIKDVVAYLQLLNNPRNDVAFQRIINMPPRGIGKSTVARLVEHARGARISLLDACREAGQIESITRRAAAALAQFVQLYDGMLARLSGPLARLVQYVVEASRYVEYLEGSESEDDVNRLENLNEFCALAGEFDEEFREEGTLERFLERVALVADADDWESEGDLVSMMTLHAAKGLEFPCVFLIALEQGTLPHERSRHELDKVEEERRLLFVGITRAEQELQLSMAQYRTRRGGRWPTVASEFLMELPREEMQVLEPVSRWRRQEQDEWSQLEGADRDEFEDWQPARRQAPVAAPGLPRITTAANLARGGGADHAAPARRYPPSAFRQGMMVHHPLYGAGQILSLSGEGDKCTATIRFFTAGEHSFRLAFAPLVPGTAEEP